MDDSHNRIPVAQPVMAAPQARPAGHEGFPNLTMNRAEAAVDLVVVMLLMVWFQILFIISGLPLVMTQFWPDFGLMATNLVIGGFCLLLVACCLWLRHQSLAHVGLNRPTAFRFWLATPLGLPACYVGSILGFLVYALIAGFDLEEMATEKLDLFEIVADFPSAWILPFAVFVGIHEEILFRGFLLGRLRALLRSNAMAIIFSSVVFGLLHFYQGVLGMFQTAAIGAALAIVVTYSRTLWPAIIAHAAFDAINIHLMPRLLDLLEDTMELPTVGLRTL